jgi:hypothetical protein
MELLKTLELNAHYISSIAPDCDHKIIYRPTWNGILPSLRASIEAMQAKLQETEIHLSAYQEGVEDMWNIPAVQEYGKWVKSKIETERAIRPAEKGSQ